MARASFFFATRSVAWTGERACCSGSLPGRPRDEPSRRGSEDRDRRVSRMRVRCAPVVLPTDSMGKWDQTLHTAFSAERLDDSTTPVERGRDRGARAECDRRSSRCEQHIPATRVCRFSHVGRRCVQLGVGSIRNLPNESPSRREVEAGWWVGFNRVEVDRVQFGVIRRRSAVVGTGRRLRRSRERRGHRDPERRWKRWSPRLRSNHRRRRCRPIR